MTNYTTLSDSELTEALNFHRRQRNMSRGINEAAHARQTQMVRMLEAEEARRLDEAVKVDKKNYSWGKMITVHHGSSHSFPLHPEHQEKIKNLKDGESTAFKDETGSHVTANREGDKVHLKLRGVNQKTTVAHSHFTESIDYSKEKPNKYVIYKHKNKYGVSQDIGTGYNWDHSYHHGYHDTVDSAKAWAAKHAGKYAHKIEVKEEVELDEAVKVDKKNYSWGKLITVRHGSNHSFPLHPEHQEKIKNLKDGEATAFKDETGSHVTASREGDKVHLKLRGVNQKTTVAHSHFTEEVNQIDELSKTTLKSYVSKKANQIIDKDEKSNPYGVNGGGSSKERNKDFNMLNLARKKVAEEVDLDESNIKGWKHAASDLAKHRSRQAAIARGEDPDANKRKSTKPKFDSSLKYDELHRAISKTNGDTHQFVQQGDRFWTVHHTKEVGARGVVRPKTYAYDLGTDRKEAAANHNEHLRRSGFKLKPRATTTESIEHIDEISRDTLGSYLRKARTSKNVAGDELQRQSVKMMFKDKRSDAEKERGNAAAHTYGKRSVGISTALKQISRKVSEEVDLDEEFGDYSSKKTSEKKSTSAHPDGKPIHHILHNGEVVGTIEPYSAYREKRKPGSRIVSSRTNVTKYSVHFHAGKGPTKSADMPLYHKLGHTNVQSALKSAADVHSDWLKKSALKEEVDQIDEISKSTLGSYLKKASKNVDSLSNQRDNVQKDMSKTYSAIAKRSGTENAAHNAITQSQHNKATAAYRSAAKTANKALEGHGDLVKQHTNLTKKINKRMDGMDRAYDKMHAEEVDQIDELSKKTLSSYIKNAVDNKAVQDRYAGRTGDRESYSLSDKRDQGIKRAVDKLTSEEVELDEGYNDPEYIRRAIPALRNAVDFHKELSHEHDKKSTSGSPEYVRAHSAAAKAHREAAERHKIAHAQLSHGSKDVEYYVKPARELGAYAEKLSAKANVLKEEVELGESTMPYNIASALQQRHYGAAEHHKKNGNMKGYKAHMDVASKIEDAMISAGSHMPVRSKRIEAASDKAFMAHPHRKIQSEASLLGPQGAIHKQASVDQSDREYLKQMAFKNAWKAKNPGKKWPGYEKAGFNEEVELDEASNNDASGKTPYWHKSTTAVNPGKTPYWHKPTTAVNPGKTPYWHKKPTDKKEEVEINEASDLRITKIYNKWPKKATYAVHTPDRKYFKEFDSMEAAKAHHDEKTNNK